MLQVDIMPFASDALEDAMRLAQTKSLNSYTFSDCLNFLNYVWSDIYSQICMIDSGYYSITVQLKEELTKLPKFVKNTIMIYAAQRPTDYRRDVFRQSGDTDQRDFSRYRISGTDLFCPDAARRTVWLEYCPQPSQIFFTHHNRDPKIYPDGHATERSSNYNIRSLACYKGEEFIDISSPSVTKEQIASINKVLLVHKNVLANIDDVDITGYVLKDSDEDGKWELKYISCDFPYIFCSYQHSITDEWMSGFFDKNMEWTDYNPFEWIGRNDNVEYLSCHYNDKTGMGVIVRDWNDIETKLLNTEKLPEKASSIIFVENDFEYKCSDGTVTQMTQGYWYNRYATDYNYERVPFSKEAPSGPDDRDVVNVNGVIKQYNASSKEWKEIIRDSIPSVAKKETSPRVKELGWTPDTRLVYPAPEVYRYLVARLAEKFSALNESNVMAVQSELADAKFAFQAFLKKDKSAWERIRNVNPSNASDWL
ncbi:hypothetical protein HDR60_03060 [bacterium]|nr:hypothetical protein [bacterium]